VVAAERPEQVQAVVSRGGRPDLASVDALSHVQAPTLLIVGGADTEVLRLNRTALAHLSAGGASGVRLEVVAGATHLFEEPGTLDTVSDLAATWFERHLLERRIV
jgi:dienelactone hydrolase